MGQRSLGALMSYFNAGPLTFLPCGNWGAFILKCGLYVVICLFFL